MTTCAIDSCDRTIRARGLCITHYNQTQPNRHTTKTVECVVCGTSVTRTGGGGRKIGATCSTECRRRLTFGDHCEIPLDHWARMYGTRSPLYVRECEGCASVFATRYETKTRCQPGCEGRTPCARFTAGRCVDCDASFVAETSGATIMYCTTRCARRVAKRTRRAREHNAPGEFRYSEVMRIYRAQGHVCAYCQQPVPGLPDPEHVTPLSRGGRNDASNLVASCRACNTDKRDLTLTEWAADRLRRGLPVVRTHLDTSTPAFAHLILDRITLLDLTA